MIIFNSPYFIIAMIFAFISMALFYYKKVPFALVCLFLCAIFLRLFSAHLDPFLHDWDEKFHALVARNMMDHPFKPILRINPIDDYDYKVWCCNHIWLHKQPLFMWQMALSMKLFGISEITARYPSILMGALMVPMIYRITKLLTKNELTAFMSAMFLCFSSYHLELIGGRYGMDHNDVAFGFYVLASIWAYCEYLNSPKKIFWVFLIGLFAGCAILNKWLTGLLVFSGWGVNILLNIKKEKVRQEILYFLVSLIVCTLVFLPWQIYIFHAFPLEARHEFEFNSRHIFEVIEVHEGGFNYYAKNFFLYFGRKKLWLFVPVGLIFVLAIKSYRNKIGIALITCFSAVFIFFSFIVQSKLPSYFFVVAPIGFIFIAITIEKILVLLKVYPLMKLALVICVCIIVLDPGQIKFNHRPYDTFRLAKIHNTVLYKSAKNYLPSNIRYVMNLGEFADVEFMFYNPGITAYHYCISESVFNKIKRASIPIALFKDRPGYNIPGYLKGYEHSYFINVDIE